MVYGIGYFKTFFRRSISRWISCSVKGCSVMEEMMNVLKRKSQIMYDMNCIEKYIGPGESDERLSKAWTGYKSELEEVEEELKLLSNPSTKVFEEKKLALRHQIEDYKRQIHMLEHQVKEIESKIGVLV